MAKAIYREGSMHARALSAHHWCTQLCSKGRQFYAYFNTATVSNSLSKCTLSQERSHRSRAACAFPLQPRMELSVPTDQGRELAQSNAMTSSRSSVCSKRDFLVQALSFSSSFRFRALSSPLQSALFEGPSSSESTMSTSSCSCAYFGKQSKEQ